MLLPLFWHELITNLLEGIINYRDNILQQKYFEINLCNHSEKEKSEMFII